jgi:hypothetical protein
MENKPETPIEPKPDTPSQPEKPAEEANDEDVIETPDWGKFGKGIGCGG